MPTKKQDEPLGLRERKKLDKLDRIIRAARDEFIQNGYQQATIRKISSRAGVAFGTIFRYASDKRDLLFLIYNDDLERMSESAFEGIDTEAPLIDQLLTVFRPFYQFFYERPELARDVLREMNFYEQGSQGIRFSTNIRRIEDKMEKIVLRCRDKGMINTQASTRRIAVLLFGLYRTEVRAWLSRPNVDVDQGLSKLRLNLEIVINGLDPRDPDRGPSHEDGAGA